MISEDAAKQDFSKATVGLPRLNASVEILGDPKADAVIKT